MGATTIKNYTNAIQYYANDSELSNQAFLWNYYNFVIKHPPQIVLENLTYLKKVVPVTTIDQTCSVWVNSGFGGFNSTEGYEDFLWNNTMSYNPWNTLTTPIIMYIELKTVAEVVNNSGNYYPCGVDMPTNINPRAIAPISTAADFLAAHGNKKIINKIVFYDNRKDGNINKLNQRTVIGQVGVVASSSNKACELMFRYSATKFVTNVADYDILVPILNTFFIGIHNQNTDMFWDGAEAFWASSPLDGLSSLKGFNTYVNSASIGLINQTLTTDQANIYRFFDSSSVLKQYLNRLGVPFTFSLAEATGTNSSSFPDYTGTGQPTDTQGGGTGTGDNSSDDINGVTPDITTIGSFNRQYAVSNSMLNIFSEYLWTDTFLQDINLLFNNPAEGVVSCRMYPFSLPSHDSAHVGASEMIKVGNVTTTAAGYPITSGYNCKFNLGSIKIEEYYGSALDYEPYTTIQIYLPYIGIKMLSTNDVMNKQLAVEYIIDITTGTCIVNIKVGQKILYIFEGKIGIDIPINSSNASQLSASLALSMLSGTAGAIMGGVTGNPLMVAGSILTTAKTVASSQYHINKGGMSSPMASLFMPQYCYLIIERPIQSLASTFGATHGFPCNVSKILSSLTGYTEVESPILNGISATEQEKIQIKNLLETGVIIQ